MFEFAWPWIFALLPLPWLMRILLPAADSGEPALKVSFLGDLEQLARRRARANLPTWRQQAPFILQRLQTGEVSGASQLALGQAAGDIFGIDEIPHERILSGCGYFFCSAFCSAGMWR